LDIPKKVWRDRLHLTILEKYQNRNFIMPPIPVDCLPLAEIKTGEKAVYIGINAEKSVSSRLTSLGFTPGVLIDMMQNYGRGPLMVTIRGTRIALGREEARNIFVQIEETA
jgi:ferrous iron transport protein A